MVKILFWFAAHVTYRLLKRANLVLKAVKEAQLVDNIYHIQKVIPAPPHPQNSHIQTVTSGQLIPNNSVET